MSCDVTVALLTINARPLIERLLAAVKRQETERSVEILAVDSNSTDGTLDVHKSFGVRVFPIASEDFDFGRTRDLAYQHARGGIVVNLSQDAVPAHNRWLENLIQPLEDPQVAVSCGASLPDPERSMPQFPWERNGYFYFTREIRNFVAQYGKGVSFANSAVSRSVWERLRFDPQPLGEDFQFQKKLVGEGLGMAFPEEAQVLHHHDYTLRTLYNRCRQEGLALRLMGCPYSEWDLARDMASPGKYLQWSREMLRGRLKTGASVLFPVLRPAAVYMGSRFGHYDPNDKIRR